MELKSDEIWEVFNGAKSFDEFQKNILKQVYIKPQVPEDIKSEIQIIEKLLLHSYFEYHFIDLALSESIFALEKCIRIRYSEITGKPSKKLSFAELIDWCFDNTYFETANKDILNQLRNIRNGKVHSEQKSLGGIAYLQKVYSVFYLINDLYEDSTLRIIRKNEIENLQKDLNDFLKDGGIINHNGKRTIIFKADIVFLDNKSTTNTLSLVVWPIFDPEPYRNDRHFKPYSFEIQIKDWQLNANAFIGLTNGDNTEISFLKITDDNNIEKFNRWRDEFYSLKDFSLILFLTYDLNDNFYNALGKFHTIPHTA
jgi:hypothetical protein